MQYQIGSSLPPNAPSYVARQADQDFYEKLRTGEFCYVLNSRQMGKSSLRVQTMQRLQAEGIACAAIDITQIGSFEVTQDQWYATLVKILADSFQIEFKLSTWWRERELLSPLRRFSEFIEEVLLTGIAQNLVIFVDEIDSVLSLNFSTDDFFAFIRACYNQRVDKPEYRRITFALLGVATPSDLIQDRKRTPFNIGQAIQLNGFHLSEAQSLAEGLVGKVIDPQVVLKELLAWTGGQPFLTQKLCQLVLMSSSPIPAGGEAESVARLVRSQVIEHWESQDQPEHLRTIRDRILSQQLAGRILELYKQILKHNKVVADDSPEQMELRLSGLAIKQQSLLSVSNRIYASVFNQSWVDKALSDLRPYAEALEAWVASNYLDDSRLLRGQALHDAQLWAADRSLSDLDYQFLLEAERKATETERRANQILTEARQKANQRIRIASVILTMSLVMGIIGLITGKVLLYQAAKETLQNQISLGDKILVRSNTSLNKKAGVQAFAADDFKTGINKFQASLQRNRNDPETLIYLNNAKLVNGNTLKIVVSVPIGSNPDVAQEILRGVAQAQNEVNHRRDIHGNLLGINSKQLQVEIADDKNDPELAKKVAARFVEDPQILAVVGHNATDVSIAAAAVYQNQLVMISPTSFSNSLSENANLQNRNYIFRTVPSIIPVAENLANYMITSHKTRIAICSDFQAVDNNAFRNAFIAQIQRDGGKIIDQGCNFSNPKFNPSDVIAQAIKAGADSLLLAPYVDRINKAVELAHANHGRLALFGSPTLDTSKTLESGKADVKDLVIAGFFNYQAMLETKFGKEANKLWGTRVNWRTVMAYDASKAIIKGFEQSNTDRDKLQNVLSKPDFSADGSMEKIQFQTSSGERIVNDCKGSACLIKVQPGSNSGTGYDFVPLMSRCP